MTGKILSFDLNVNTGIISGDNAKRYNFSKDSWKENMLPKKMRSVDFNVNEDGEAIDIYTLRNIESENINILFGLIAIIITFMFGFIGTFISRIMLAKKSFFQSIFPTIIHLFLTLLVFIPILGWIAYMLGTIYYMYRNYLLATNNNDIELEI